MNFSLIQYDFGWEASGPDVLDSHKMIASLPKV
jgi:hypothetical protein